MNEANPWDLVFGLYEAFVKMVASSVVLRSNVFDLPFMFESLH